MSRLLLIVSLCSSEISWRVIRKEFRGSFFNPPLTEPQVGYVATVNKRQPTDLRGFLSRPVALCRGISKGQPLLIKSFSGTFYEAGNKSLFGRQGDKNRRLQRFLILALTGLIKQNLLSLLSYCF